MDFILGRWRLFFGQGTAQTTEIGEKQMRHFWALFALIILAFPATADAQTARATAAAPTYSEGSIAPVSQDLSGSIRSIITGSIPAGSATIGAVDLNAGVNSIGTVGLDAGANTIGAVDLNAGANSIGTVGLDTGANTIGLVGINAGVASIGTVGLDAGANTIGAVDLNAGTNTLGTVGLVPNTSGGLTPSKTISAATTNATNIKSSAGQVYSVAAYNNTENIAYLKFYNTSSAPTCNSDTVVLTLLIPGSATGSGLNFSVPQGIAFSTGISICITGAIGDTDNTAVAADAYVVNLGYN